METSTQESEDRLIGEATDTTRLGEQVLAIIENALDAVITINAAGVITSWNSQAEQIFGWTRREALGLKLSDTIIPPQYRAAHERGMKHYLATGEGPVLNKRIEITGRHRAGNEFPIELTISPIQTGNTVIFSAFVRDITAQKRAAEALQESEARTHAILNTAAEGIITIDEQGIIETFNPAAARIFGYRLDEVIGCNVSMLMPEPYSSRHDGHIAHFLATGQGKIIGRGREIEGRRKDGNIFPIYLAVSEVKLGDRRLFTGIVRDITDLKQAEESLRQLNEALEQRVTERTAALTHEISERKRAEQQYRDIFEQAPAMYVITEIRDGVPVIKDCNRLFTATLGYRRGNVLGKPLANFYTTESQSELQAGGYQRALAGTFVTEERQLVRQDGELVDTLLRATPETDTEDNVIGTRAMFVDISARRKIEAAEREQRKLAEALHQAALIISSTLNFDTILDHLLGQMAQVIPYDVAQVMLIKGELAQSVRLRRSQQSELTIYEYKENVSFNIAATGNLQELVDTGQPLIISDTAAYPLWQQVDSFSVCRSWAGAPILIQGRAVAIFSLYKLEPNFYQPNHLARLSTFAGQAAVAFENARLYQQVRQHAEELEQRVAERTAELRAANAELARAARMKDEFLASMSHELRTPLNAILGMSEALQEQTFGSLNEEQLEALHDVEESGRHLLSLINDILDLSKIEAGKLELQIEPVSIEDVSRASLRLIKQPAHQKQLKVLFTLDETVTTVPADERYLKQILVNLLTNAVKFTPEGGQIGLDIMGDTAQDFVCFTVWDTGIGIPAEDVERLFQPFVQLDSRLDRSYGGTGLGLALVYRMTEFHGGSVSVSSEPGQGSRFTVTLPWVGGESRLETEEFQPVALSTPADTADMFQVPAANIDRQSPNYKPLILLAEDNKSNIKTISRYLAQIGYRIEVALNGIEAISRTRELEPDLILMDIQMSEMDGLEAMKLIRTDPHLADIPIIAVTALAMAGDRERCLAVGANEYLSKPVNLKVLAETIKTILATPPTRTTPES